MQELIDSLNQAIQEGRVVTDAGERAFYAQDVFTDSIPAGVVVSPGNTAELATVVGAATRGPERERRGGCGHAPGRALGATR